MADILLVIPGSAQNTNMNHMTDQLWIIVNGSINWNPTGNLGSFNNLLSPATYARTLPWRTAYGPYTANSKGVVTIDDPAGPIEVEEHRKDKKHDGDGGLTPHTITVS